MKRIFTLLISSALVLFCASSCAHLQEHTRAAQAKHRSGHAVHWEYFGKGGPDYWGDLDEKFLACKKGKNQTPVNISGSVSADLNPISFVYHTNASEILNNGHTVKANYERRSVIIVDDRKYELKQFHFHTPSENVINKEYLPMEAHFVHADMKGNLAVVGVMYVIGEANPALEKLLAQMPEKPGDKYALKSSVNAMELMPEKKDYYRFTGSLTTPPCSEGVLWLVLKNPVTISKEQLVKFSTVMARNNRPLQPVNSRVILSGP